MSALSDTCLPRSWKKLKTIGHTIRPPQTQPPPTPPFTFFKIICYFLSFSHSHQTTQLILSSQKKAKANCNHDESSASNFDFENWAKIIYQIYIEKRSSLCSKNGRECPLHSTIWLVDPQARNTAIGLLKATWCVPITYWTRSSFRVNVENVAFTAP